MPRDLYVVTGARCVALLGNQIAVTALLLQLHATGAGGWAIAALLVVSTLPIVLLAPVIGWMVDRYDSRTLIVVSGLWQTVACAVLAFADQVFAILALALVNALGSAVTNPVYTAMARCLVPDHQMSAVAGLQQGTMSVAVLVGPTVGGMLTGLTGGSRAPLLFGAAVLLGITVTGLVSGVRRRPQPTEKARVLDGITTIMRDRTLATVTVLALQIVLVAQLATVSGVFLIRDTFRASPTTYGVFVATYTVGILIGTAVGSRLRSIRAVVLASAVAAATTAASFAAIGLSPWLWLVFVLYAMAGAGGGVVAMAAWTLLLRSPVTVIGRVLASFHGVTRAAALTAYGLGGVVIGFLSPQRVYLVTGAVTLLLIGLTVPAIRRAWLAH